MSRKVHADIEREEIKATDAVNMVHAAVCPAPQSGGEHFRRLWSTGKITPPRRPGAPRSSSNTSAISGKRRAVRFRFPPSKEDGVRLMTVHAAKGLEFGHVAILRGSSTSFPCPYREPLVDFPRELRPLALGAQRQSTQRAGRAASFLRRDDPRRRHAGDLREAGHGQRIRGPPSSCASSWMRPLTAVLAYA